MGIEVEGADPARVPVGRKPERRKARLGGCFPFSLGRIPVGFGESYRAGAAWCRGGIGRREMGVFTRRAKNFRGRGFLLALMNEERVVLPACAFCRRVVAGKGVRFYNPRIR